MILREHGYCLTVNGILTAICIGEAAYILVLLAALGVIR